MTNNVELIGRVVRKPELKMTDNDKKYAYITLAVQRDYKNKDGVYETDFIDAILWGTPAEYACNYLDKGSLAGLKGSIQTRNVELENGKKEIKLDIVGNKISFLAKSKSMENREDR